MLRTFCWCLVLWLPLACLSGVRPLVVMGSSMEPALLSGQLALLDGEYYRIHALRRGDIVAFRWEGRVYVKRVYALAGDRVRFLCDGEDCLPVKERLGRWIPRRLGNQSAWRARDTEVPAGQFFCLGDHLAVSLDSRDLGPIPVAAILGRVRSL